MSRRLNEFIHRQCLEQCRAPGKHSANESDYLVNIVVAAVIASTHERTIRRTNLYISLAFAEIDEVLYGMGTPKGKALKQNT